MMTDGTISIVIISECIVSQTIRVELYRRIGTQRNPAQGEMKFRFHLEKMAYFVCSNP